MLPFLTGLVVGSALTLLYTKRDELKKAVNSPAFKDKVQQTKDLSKQTYNDVKDKVEALNLKDKAKEIFARFKSEGAQTSQKQSAGKSTTKSNATRKTSAKKSQTAKSKSTAKSPKTASTAKPKDS